MMKHKTKSEIVHGKATATLIVQQLIERPAWFQLETLNNGGYRFRFLPNKGLENLFEVPHVQVEYDMNYTGDDYNKTGEFALIPLTTVLAETGSFEDDVKNAFEKQTGLDRRHIIHFSSDELFDFQGTPWDEFVPTSTPLQVVLGICRQVCRTLKTLANSAGDVPEWNEGGHAYESTEALKGIIERYS